jgi:opacity protein-like surface antigen
MKGTSFSILLLAFGATCASTRVLADDLPGFYVGAAIGESHVRTVKEIVGDNGYDYEFDGQHSAWKVTAGVRPISPLGVELEYIDFGNPSAGLSNAGFGGLSKADQRAVTLFGLGYLPIPVPFLDVYGKLGIARLHTTTTEVSPIPFCPAGFTSCSATTFNISDSSTNFAYGAGVQGKIGSLAIRAEYEGISASGGNPYIFSLGVTWTF